ncbi:hypothetical protein O181_003022 [Austropuccinia psidii MF-1]|uniref:Uncharacterized protein n=1 Tax=Austropuccinia psidii MF-1 TaxID=1389203 RepID=A0A9Q3BDX5_9BASI|nr:hypothetical protein [Austropuccinia psidii MF-1]
MKHGPSTEEHGGVWNPSEKAAVVDETAKPELKHPDYISNKFRAELRNYPNFSNRHMAKCGFCNITFNGAKPSILFSHIKDSCTKIPTEKRLRYIKQNIPKDHFKEGY